MSKTGKEFLYFVLSTLRTAAFHHALPFAHPLRSSCEEPDFTSMQIFRRDLHLALPILLIPGLNSFKCPQHAHDQITRLHQRLLPSSARSRPTSERHEFVGLGSEVVPAFRIKDISIRAPNTFLAMQNGEVPIKERASTAEYRRRAVRAAASGKRGVGEGNPDVIREDRVEAEC